MKHEIKVRTKNSTGHYETETKDEAMEFIEAMHLLHKVDAKKHLIGNTERLTQWAKVGVTIECNFKA